MCCLKLNNTKELIMGNQSGKSTSGSIGKDLKQENASDEMAQRLAAHFDKIIQVGTAGDGKKSIDLQTFKCLFSLDENFGEKIFNCWLRSFETPPSDFAMSREQFIKFANRIIDLTRFPDQMEYYFEVFSGGKDSLSTADFRSLAKLSISLELAKFSTEVLNIDHDPILQSMEKSLFNKEDMVTKSDLRYWMNRHCPKLMHAIHPYVLSVLYDSAKEENPTTPVSDMLEQVKDNQLLLSFSLLWALNTYMSTSYTTHVDSQASDVGILQSHSLVDILGPGGWQLLYNSNAQGLSLNRFENHVMSYAAPTLTFIEFENHLYCVGSDSEWIEKTERWGGPDCFLLQVLPEYRVIQAGPGLLYLNIQDRKLPKGIFFGKDTRSTILQIDSDFAKVKHYGIETALMRIEVWGCGNRSSYEAQLEQRKWEHKDAERHKNRKLKMEDWKDNPDRQLLEMGGIQTEHAER